MPVTNTPLTLSYFVRDVTNALLTYDRLRWWKSTSGSGVDTSCPPGADDGLYTVITQPAATAAVLTAPDTEPHELFGKTLSLMINGVTQVDVTFTTADPVTSAAAAIEIAAASALITAAADSDGKIAITSVQTGTGASIEVLASAGAIAVGFQTGDYAIGQGTDTVLVSGTHEYFFTDNNSSSDYFYRVQFFNSTTLAASELSVAFPANKAESVPKSQTIVVFMRLVDLTGAPIQDRKVTLTNTFLPNRVDITASQSAGVFRGFAEKSTDRNGYVEFRLLRGIEVDVSVEATSFVRRITIPTTGDIVDLLDPTLNTRDEFGIQEQNVDFAIRLS